MDKKHKKLSRFLSVTLTVTTAVWLSGLAMFAPVADAAIVDGDIVSPDATYTDDDGNTYYPYDVFIVKIVGTKTFKRLILNPQVFDSYGHLKWANIQTISATTVAGYTTSSLVRAIDDTKVYKLFPDGDSGTKRWVETLDCFTTKGYDWDSVYIINSVDRDNYNTGTNICGAVGEITLSLASDSPVAATIPKNAYGVTFMKVKVEGSGRISQLTLKRSGAGDVDDFDNVYIYENGTRLTTGRTISSATGKATFINLKLDAPTTFEIVADLSGTPGNEDYFEILSASDVTADATVGGTFPLAGNPMGMSGTNAGTLTVARSGSNSYDVTIGDLKIEISQFKVTTATEGSDIHRIQLFNGGTVDNLKITNLKLVADGVTLATADEIGSDGYVTFVLSSPYSIKKGGSKIFRIYADIGAVRPERNIKLYLELQTDILGLGSTYGYGMAATIDDYDSGTYITATCKGGDLTLAKIGPNAGKIGDDTDDTVFLEFSMMAAADITIKRTSLIFCSDVGGDGAYDAWTSGSAGPDIEDIKIKEKDTGTVIVGPKDGTSFDDYAAGADDSNNACPGDVDGVAEHFTDTFDIATGESKILQITADVKVDRSDVETDRSIIAGDKLKFLIYSYASLVGDDGTINYMKYTGTTDAVPGTAIVPSSNMAGEEQEVEAASLTLALSATPTGAGTDARSFVKGEPTADVVGFIFESGTASDITVTGLTLTAFASCDGTTLVAGLDGGSCYAKNAFASVEIWDTTADARVPGSSAQGFQGTDKQDVVYTGLNWLIPAGETRTLLVKGNLSAIVPTHSTDPVNDYYTFDIELASDIDSNDADGNDITESGVTDGTTVSTSPNTTGATVNIAVYPEGTITIAKATDTPLKGLAVMGTSDYSTSKLKLTGAREASYIEKFSVLLGDGEGADTKQRDNFTGVKLKYQTESQWGTSDYTISSAKTFGANASLAFSFSGTSRIYVPKNDYSTVEVLVNVDSYRGGDGANSKAPFRFATVSGSSSSFIAYGAKSGKLFTNVSGGETLSDFNLHFITRAKPIFAKKAWTGEDIELAYFTITAEGYDVEFTETAGVDYPDDFASAGIAFDVVASSTADATGDLELYDWNENVISSVQGITWGDESAVSSVAFHFETQSTSTIIPAGETKAFKVKLGGSDKADFNRTDEYIYLKLVNDKSDFGDLATDDFTAGGVSVVWHDGTDGQGITESGADGLRYGMPEDITGCGFPITFRTLQGQVQ